MGDRKRRKKNKLRGQRTMGAGNTKNRRGAGSRGGRGRAGANKHKFHSLGRLKERKYRQKAQAQKAKEIQLGELNLILDKLVSQNKVVKEGEKYIVDKKSGYGKVLSQGATTKKIILKINASKKAITKILKSGGKFEYAKKGYTSSEEQSLGEEDEDLEFESVEGEKE